jgi:hypothetical protein
MVVARAKAGLSPMDLESLRAAVEAGRKPKVTFTASAGQIAGRTGQVTRLEDPTASEEWVVVRFGKDELPFAPSDLEIPPKPVPAKAVQRAKVIEPPQWSPAAPSTPERPRADPAGSADGGAPARGAASSGAASGGGAAAASSGTTSSGTTSSGTASSGTAAKPAADAAGPAARPGRKSAPKRPAELTVTLNHEDGNWTVQAQRGAKVLVKPTPVRASDALKMVGLLDAPAVHAVVEEIVEAARAEAEQQAERLRRELAEVEAALADLRDLD